MVAFASKTLNIYAIGDGMSKKGWHLSALANPPALHMAFTVGCFPQTASCAHGSCHRREAWTSWSRICLRLWSKSGRSQREREILWLFTVRSRSDSTG